MTVGDAVRAAQRRPGSRPRRHVEPSGERYRLILRSTKAGVETPATRPAGFPGRTIGRRSTKAGVETPATPIAKGYYPLTINRSTKAGVETPATLLIGAKKLHGRNSAPDLATHGRDVDHLFGPCLGVDVVAGPEMPSESWTSHNLEPADG